MHKNTNINRLVLAGIVLAIIVVSFLAGFVCALKIVGDDRQKEIDAIEQRINN